MKINKIANIIRKLRKEKKEQKVIYPFNYGGKPLMELFTSLRDEIKQAVVAKFGKKVWLDDFSDTEAIFSKDAADGRQETNEEGETVYYKVSYAMMNGELVITSDPKPVTRVTSYVEGTVSLRAFLNMTIYRIDIDKRKKND